MFRNHSRVEREWEENQKAVGLKSSSATPYWYSWNVSVALISPPSKVILKILQARLQQYMNWELLDIQAGFRKGRAIRDQIANIHWIIENARGFQKNIYYSFIEYAKAFDCVDHKKTVENSWKRWQYQTTLPAS